MTASEKLRELDAVLTDLSPFAGSELVTEITMKEGAAVAIIALRCALPELVAVVEAAQENAIEPKYAEYPQQGELFLALRAFEAKLTADGNDKEEGN